MNLIFHTDELAHADVQALLRHHFEQMRVSEPPEACHVLPADALGDPAITLVTARTGHTLAGIGALRELAPDHGEIKSMRVADDFLGRGVGRALLDHLIFEARRRGYRRLSLETGNSSIFDAANYLYERAGFERCGRFGDYPDTPHTNFYTRTIG
jgi:putative acetyltransferase